MIQDDLRTLHDLGDALQEELETCRTSGIQLAENESEYRVALRSEMLKERAKGTPVTIIGDVCRGEPNVSELKLRRDCAEATYKASQEAINVHKLRMRVLNDAVQRDWNSG